MKTTYPIKTICQILDLTERRVRQLVTDGILPKNSERGRYELIPTVKGYIHWLRNRSLYGEAKAKSGNVVSLDEASRRKLIAEAELAELELQKERGEVVSIEEAEKSWTKVLGAVRAKILALPTTMAAVSAVDLGGRVGVTVGDPQFVCRTSDVSSAAEGDALVTGSVNYTIRDVIDDGTGMTSQMLETD